MRFPSFTLIVVICSALLSFDAYAQEPSFEILGGKELAGLTIYDQLMVNDELLYIATDDGVYTYNSIDFEKITPPKAVKGRSYFNLKADKLQRVYCSNLNGQLFRIEEQQLNLLYELPDSLIASFTPIIVLEENIIITGKRPILLDEDGQFIRFLEKNYYQFGSEKIFAFENTPAPNDTAILRQVSSKDLKPIPNTEIRCSPHDMFGVFYQHRNQLFGADLTGGYLYGQVADFYQTSQIKVDREIRRGIKVNDSLYWAKVSPHGVLQSSMNLLDTSQHKVIFADRYAAPQEVTKNGVFLGSDGSGIYLVKNLFFENLSSLNQQYDILEIIEAGDHGFIISTAENEVILVDNDLRAETILQSKKRLMNITFHEELDYIYLLTADAWWTYKISTKELVLYQQEVSAVIKYLAPTSTQTVLFGGTFGYGQIRLDHQNGIVNTSGYNKHKMRARSCVEVDGHQYFGTYNGVRRLDTATNSWRELQYNGRKLVAAELFNFDNQLIIHTIQDGLLTLTGDQLHPFNFELRPIDAAKIRAVFVDDNYLLISTRKSLIIFNKRTGKQQQIGLSDGLLSLNVKSAFVSKGKLHLLTHWGIQTVVLSNIQEHIAVPIIKFSQKWMNDTLLTSEDVEFDHSQNRLKVRLGGNAFGQQVDTKFKYQLKGLTEKWHIRDYHDNLIEYQSLPPGAYTLRVLPIYKEKEGDEISYSFSISAPFWKTWWFYVSSILAGVALSVLLYRRYSRRRIDKISLEKEFHKLRLVAIQSQMNPHFIFNSINAIQETALENDGRTTYRHINKFAKLVRLTMHHSEREVVSIQEEMELIESYLDLEKIRFAENFNFHIDVAAYDQLLIPPLFIQPILENAIIHGLFHKKGDKTLRLSILEEPSYIHVVVEDNGIGRAAAMAIKHRQQPYPEKSFATGAIQDRLNILKKRYSSNKVKLSYVDLIDTDGQASGTRVELYLPLINKL